MSDHPVWNFLRCPVSGAPLTAAAHGERLETPDRRFSYPVRQGVPILLPPTEARRPGSSPLHQHYGSRFDYLDHYLRDAEAFDYQAGYEEPATQHEIRRLREAILTELPPRPGRLLDVGCGGGWLAAALCPEGIPVVSMDVSLRNVSRALQRVPSPHHLGIVADAFHPPFAPGTFDAMVAAEVIEHVPDPEALLKQLLQIKHPRGTLVVSTPYREKLNYSLCVHCHRLTPHNAHLHSFSRSALRARLPEEYRRGAELKRLNSKLLIHLPTHVLLKHLPYAGWRAIDRLANLLVNRPSRLIMTVGGRD